jgi:hypothetical protein
MGKQAWQKRKMLRFVEQRDAPQIPSGKPDRRWPIARKIIFCAENCRILKQRETRKASTSSSPARLEMIVPGIF